MLQSIADSINERAERLATVDLCPVCGDNHPSPGNVYCSEKCRRIAYIFRKRIMYTKHFLTELGFLMIWTNGVQLRIQIPNAIKFAYPESCHTFYFPDDPALDIESLNASDLWMLLGEYLGEFTGKFVKWLFVEDRPERDTLYSCVQLAQYDENQSFRCPKCGRKYIKSDMSRGGDLICTDVHSGDHPF